MSSSAVPVQARPALRLRSQAAALAAVLLLALGLRLYHLGTSSLWTDELFTRFYPKMGLGFLWTQGLRMEPTPPLYESLIALLERVAGESTFVLRLPSLVGSMLSIWLASLLARELTPRPAAAVLAALLLALAPANISFAQEARSYALQGAALAVALLGFARFLRMPDRTGSLVLYGAGALLAIYFHMTSVFPVAAFNLAAVVSALGRGRLLSPKALLRWIAANAVVAVACAPLLPILLSSTGAAATSWIPPLTRWSAEAMIGGTLAGPIAGDKAMLVGECLVAGIAALLLLPPWRAGRRAWTVLLLVPGMALLLMAGVSVAKPVLLGRTVAWVLVPLAVVLGDVLARRVKLVGVAVVALVALATAVQLSRVDTTKEDWAGFLGRLPDLKPPTLIVLAPHTSPAALAVYAPGAGKPVRLDDGGPPIPETTIIPRLFGTRTISMADVQSAVAAGERVWILYRRPDYDWVMKATAGLPPPRLAVQEGQGSNPAMRALEW